MIEVSMTEATSAHGAFTRIGAAEMPPKAAYRVARLIAKLRTAAIAGAEEQTDLLKSYGGEVVAHNGMSGVAYPKAPVREKGETDADFSERERVYQARAVEIAEELKKIGEKKVSIDYDPIPLSMFEKLEQDPGDAKKQVVKSTLKPNDLADVVPFIAEA